MRVSLPTSGRGDSVYVDYGSAADRMRGAVLFFDRDLALVAVREGLLRDLRESQRPRPAVDHAEEDG